MLDSNTPPLEFTKITLGNGLDVIVRRQARLPVVAVNMWYHVGSKNEERRQRGFAHLFEHLMFEGSEHFPGDFFKPLQRIGAGINGSTSADRTNYFVDIPAAHVELAMAMESDRMGHLLPALSETKLRVQKDVVKNEYRQNYANRPYGQVGRIMAEALYPPTHPYNWLTIGIMEDVEAATLDDVAAFFRRFYVPGNASLAIVGDIGEDRAISLADRYFGGLPGGVAALRPWTPEVALAADVSIGLHEPVELDRVYDAWHTVPQFHPDDAALSLLADVLARGRAGRLYQSLVMGRELAQSVSASHAGRELAGTFNTIVSLRPGKSGAEARRFVLDEIRKIADEGVTEIELERVRNGRLAGFIFALDNVGGFGGIADRLNAYNTYLGDPSRITSDFERYESVTTERIAAVASAYLADRPRVTLDVTGTKKSVVAVLDRSITPKPGAAISFKAPVPEVRTMACGTPVWILPNRALPIVAASWVLPVGATANGEAQGGLASLTSNMLDEGTGRYSGTEIAALVEGMGSSLSGSCGWDGSYVGLQSLTRFAEPTFDLAAEILRSPTFPQDDWRRIHAQTLAALRAETDSAESRAARAFVEALYPAGHPYRATVHGSLESVSALDRGAAVHFHEVHYGSGRGAWVVAGDVDPDEIAGLLEARVGDWRPPSRIPSQPPPFPLSETARILLLNRPGAAQAVVRIGHQGIARSDSDYLDLVVLNQILGGMFTSRLNGKLREEKGFTYGIRSHFDTRRSAGPFFVSASLQADRVGEALADVRAAIVELLDDRPPTPRELDDARRALIEGQARHFETPSALVSRYAELVVHGLAVDEHARLAERLSGVTIASMLAAGHRHIRPDSLIAVVVADSDQVKKELTQHAWGEVEILGSSGGS
jgi:predicted Zn-dependent peptidase